MSLPDGHYIDKRLKRHLVNVGFRFFIQGFVHGVQTHTEPWPQPNRAPSGGTGMKTVSQTFWSNIIANVLPLISGWVVQETGMVLLLRSPLRRTCLKNLQREVSRRHHIKMNHLNWLLSMRRSSLTLSLLQMMELLTLFLKLSPAFPQRKLIAAWLLRCPTLVSDQINTLQNKCAHVFTETLLNHVESPHRVLLYKMYQLRHRCFTRKFGSQYPFLFILMGRWCRWSQSSVKAWAPKSSEQVFPISPCSTPNQQRHES